MPLSWPGSTTYNVFIYKKMAFVIPKIKCIPVSFIVPLLDVVLDWLGWIGRPELKNEIHEKRKEKDCQERIWNAIRFVKRRPTEVPIASMVLSP